ncbi:FAD-binding protein [Megasphaera cerevisiae DSM 20462]|uniref:FAD-binding protein n=1 Tax=Megasphaera cerevisiae DSM 20462 TaxID=1122219 RepID=A0A0J6X0N3_9FIRM|nr:FAD-binding oxidoreductase [Megasphaera cerevisiae]KMO87717.1 FAD-binding protein [Megasphaera cerevisiae DSM 20462]OKY53356.1 FAD-binding protein [Megasphaera cerevisiae]SJZ64535.1 glycolate oxidase [Megasphaera cerevisiae DSM 20462]
MKIYQSITPDIINALKAITGPSFVKTDKDMLLQYQTDYETNPAMFHLPEAAVIPANAGEIAEIIKLANKYDFPITVRGGGTSLADGAIPVCGGLVLSMERLNKILELNEDGMYMTVEAGVRTVDLQTAARKAGLLYAGDPSSAESCLIGGNLATNAGGLKAVRYGVTRNQVYSLEVVTPTGDIVQCGGTLKKCSTGYSLEQLIIGSEGTLGIITKVTVKLIPLAPYRFDVLAVYTDPQKALYMVPKLLKAGVDPTSVEYMDNSYVRDTADYCHYTDMPHYEDGIYVIITVETFREDELDAKMESVCSICEDSGAVDVLEADARIWNMRRNVQTSCEMISKVFLTDDVVVPVHKIAPTIEHIMKIGESYPFQVKINAHIGDGNLHIVLCKMDMDDATWDKNVEEFHQQVYHYAYSVGGRLAGEHGIGAKKLKYMEEFTPSGELLIMKTIKRAMDPQLILNPGKLIDA